MTRKIKETPILTGKDAANFLKNMKEAENKKVSPEEIARVKKNAQYLNSIFKE
ncbi:MAG TPA: hypothetical protein VL576_02680 [Candidatus Paceibacterota bacterium]|jgi:hypothetical protein|nr:hypothetical protein [Candidatus Paceibacterota bacterium]